ncbi:peptidylprolyl isomerase [Deinococcus taeanensis]|uniref:peptidylprolyl isomerase n=1 Tax=Deinococcus taeanensis TaxID=2737050 RepID=UPI001CDD7648|nr:peptidylprolyl isomerase [Deinococcus taeanensis]UBV42296.1 peptidylprolyl isomerase [Deinococcus taeanensis]
MKHAALILTALLALTACQKKEEASTSTSTTTTETTKDASTEADAASTTKTTESTAAESTGAKSATPAAVNTPGPVPAGYTAVPFLTQAPKREFAAEPDMALTDGKDYYALIDTNRGQVLADLYEQETPVTVNNFVFLARNHYFDGIRFHRVIEGFMAQTGDPKSVNDAQKTEWGTGGPGYQFADEFRQKLTFNSSGILAMANSGPATNGSQFFITFAPTDFLNGKHTIFGKVVTGEDLLPKLTRTMDGNNSEISGAVADKILTVRILTKG